jgi:hypothetical protein
MMAFKVHAKHTLRGRDLCDLILSDFKITRFIFTQRQNLVYLIFIYLLKISRKSATLANTYSLKECIPVPPNLFLCDNWCQFARVYAYAGKQPTL